jgi:uncharacterized protein YbjQ (UPF0145 family)
MTSADHLPGYEITAVLGIAEGISEKSFPIIEISNIGFSKGGGLQELIEDAKNALAHAAGELGADAIISVRYQIMGRQVEKSALAYGTAVKCKRLEAN